MIFYKVKYDFHWGARYPRYVRYVFLKNLPKDIEAYAKKRFSISDSNFNKSALTVSTIRYGQLHSETIGETR